MLGVARCFDDQHCTPGYVGGQTVVSPTRELPRDWRVDLDADAHGIFTGQCVQSMKTCEIFGWCPVQEDLDTMHAGLFKTKRFRNHHKEERGETEFDIIEPLYGLLNLTISIQNMIEFPLFNVSRQNILPWMTEDYVRNCIYKPNDVRDRYCPNFLIHDVLRLAGAKTYRILRHGGVIAITIKWKCNLDVSLDLCRPHYGFLHLDGRASGQFDELGPGEGWMIDMAYRLGNSLRSQSDGPRRLLFKVNGIQFIIQVTGEAGKFNLFIFTMSFGSNLALLSLAAIVCDFVLFHCTRDRKLYMKATHNVFLESKEAIANTPRIILDSISRKSDSVREKRPCHDLAYSSVIARALDDVKLTSFDDRVRREAVFSANLTE
ncbi:unnamed protein product [Echinostoma caproni]|uniref:ATP receptor n=1 Tax=Echinostoma caproni TaxID=27848 RepID=A0A183AAI2_9TREM|nr:unnamed protein product [Echinostoma caproni]